MTKTEVTEIVSRIRHAFPFPKWNAARFAIYAEHLQDLPYHATRAAVDELIRSRSETFAPAIGAIRARVQHMLDRAQMLRQAHQDRLLLAAPKDPAVGKILRDCVQRLERRARV